MESEIELLNIPKNQQPGQFFNLNDYAKTRFLFDMLYSIRKKCKLSPEYIILVMDEYSSSVISQFCNIFDLMEAGNIYQIEKLTALRKRYPMSDAIYLVQPSSEAVDQIIKDFPVEDEFSYDKYGQIHLCFLTPVPKEDLLRMSKELKLVNKIQTLLEVNVDFKVWQDNIFKIPVKIHDMNNIIDPDNSKGLVEELSHKLYTLCSVMNEKPFIQY